MWLTLYFYWIALVWDIIQICSEMKNQRNVTLLKGKKSNQANPEMIQMLELPDKDF